MTDDKVNPDAYKVLKKCRPDDLDNAPKEPPMPNYPSGANTQYSYNFEDSKHKILIMAADGKHGPDRWKLDQNEIGTPHDPSHEHEDFKRNPPSILQDADPKASRVGFFAQNRVPDSRDALSVPGDQLGLTPEQRAAIKKQNEL